MLGGLFRQEESYELTFGATGNSGASGEGGFPPFGSEGSKENTKLPAPAWKRKPDPKSEAQAQSSTQQENAEQQVTSNATDSSRTSVSGVDGKPLTTQATETAQATAPIRPPVPVDDAFNLGDFSPWWLAIIPVLFLGGMFRFLMGTSSSDELARYKYRGPKVEDREANDVRGRFKKRARVDAETASEELTADRLVTPSAVVDDDDLEFLDDLPAIEGFPDVYSEEPATEGPKPRLFASTTPSTNAEPALTKDQPASSVAEDTVVENSLESTPVNSIDSDDDFDFFGDEGSGLDALGTEEAASVDSQDEPTATVASGADDAFDLGQPESSSTDAASAASSGDSDCGMDFLGDSDDDFQFDDEDEPTTVPVSAEDTERNEESADGEETLTADLLEEDSLEEDSIEEDSIEEDSIEAESVETDDEQGVLEPAVAAAAVAGTAGIAASRNGSWFSRLFKRSKKKKAKIVETHEDDTLAGDSIAAIAVEEEPEEPDFEDTAAGQDAIGASDEASFDFDDMAEEGPVANASDSGSVDSGDADESRVDSGELNFSDSADSFSLNAGDDSSDGLFDDDSDAAYEFEPSDELKVEMPVAEDAAEEPTLGIADTDGDEERGSRRSDDEPLAFESTDDQHTLSIADEPIAIFEEPESQNQTIAFGNADDNLQESAGQLGIDASIDDEDEIGSIAATRPGTTQETDSEFESVPMVVGHDELPLLEDQLLDNIVDAEADPSAEKSSETELPLSLATGLAAGAVAAAVTSSNSNEDAAELPHDAAGPSDQLLAELRDKVAELEASNASLANRQAALEEELSAEQEAKRQALADAESAAQRIAETEEAAAQAKADAESLAADLKSAVAEAAAAKEQAETDLAAAKAELEVAAESSDQAFGGSLMAAATGVVAAGAIASAAGDADEKEDAADDPFRLEPEQVRVMLKKLKTERKKRLKTKEYFLAADAKRREVAATLKKVTEELQSMKTEFSELADGQSGEADSKLVAELKQKLDSVEGVLKKK